MLVRAARRSARLPSSRVYDAAYERLQLPWLCPNYSRSQKSCRRQITSEATAPDSALRRRRNSRDGNRDPATRRSLATHVNRDFEYSAFDTIPFVRSAVDATSESSANKKPWDPSQALMLGDSLATAEPRYRSALAIGGEAREMLSILDACLQVGRIERASVIIRRLVSVEALEPAQLLKAHNDFLQASLNKVVGYSSQSAAQAMHKWFELEIKDRGVQYNEETLAYMLKASLQEMPGGRRDRLIRRYMGMAPGDMGLKILHDGMFTAEDQHNITLVSKTYNYGPEVILGKEVPIKSPDLEESAATAHESKHAVIDSSQDIPLVRPTDQKGLGLKSLRQALSLLIEKDPSFDPETLNPQERRERQMRIEEDAVTAAIDRWREENTQLVKIGLDTSLQTKSLGSRMWKWHLDLSEAVRRELVLVEEAEAKEKKTVIESERCIYGPFLRYMPAEKLAAVTILTCMGTFSAQGFEKGLPLSTIIMGLAASIEDESISEKLLRDQGKLSWGKISPADRAAFVARQMRSAQGSPGHLKQDLTKMIYANRTVPKSDGQHWDPQWSSAIKAKIGAFMLSALIENTRIPVARLSQDTGELITQLQPAWTHGYQYKMGRKQGVVRANAELSRQMKREPVHSLLAKHLPMVVEPEPWTEFNKGGFILHPAKMVRIKLGDKDQRHYTEAAIANGDMEQMFKGLDVLGRTSWKINQPVFDIMLEAWNSGQGIANFPPIDPDLTLPPEPESSEDPTARRKWLREIKRIENVRGSYHSQRCFQNFQLEIARALRNETFYFPHNLDFRGRAYPIPPYLNHMGADHCRGLLVFGKGKELGPDGLRWLQVHLANVFGFDKASLSERAAFSMDHLDDIYDSVTNPLNGRRWWLTAEDPWQCLAACHELKNALESSDPTKFISHLPIHQDGTCNGLQHYAALGGDEWGARQVNLEPGDRPADVYSAVADLVKQSITEDKLKGNPFAEFLDGKITRKVVKQTVMTNVYGVTFIGAKAQVRKQLVAAYPNMPKTNELNPDFFASYIATKIFKALSTMFKGAHDIQYWLGDCANRISMSLTPEQLNIIQGNLHKLGKKKRSIDVVGVAKTRRAQENFQLEDHLQFKSGVVWTNPVRMPIVQPYRASKARVIVTNLQRISISEPHRSDPVSKRKQLQGFPPNFIHSLDATHMILSALDCDKQGLSFAAVHDSFWTHAGDVGAMNTVIRDAFIRIHSDDVIGRLRAEFQARYKGCLYLAKVDPKSKLAAALAEWRASTKRVKGQAATVGDTLAMKRLKLKELLDERERQQLLSSGNPEDVEKGKSMETAASIMESLGESGQQALVTAEELDAIAIGNITSSKSALEEEAVGEEAVNDEAVFDDVVDSSESVIEPAQHDGSMHLASDNPSYARPSFEKTMFKEKQVRRPQEVWAWLPLTFAEVPDKVSISLDYHSAPANRMQGAFDVNKLKDSQYFFS